MIDRIAHCLLAQADRTRRARGIALKGKRRGRHRRWFAMRFLGREADFDIAEKPGHKAEFSRWCPATIDDEIENVVIFKKPIHEELAGEFAPLPASGADRAASSPLTPDLGANHAVSRSISRKADLRRKVH